MNANVSPGGTATSLALGLVQTQMKTVRLRYVFGTCGITSIVFVHMKWLKSLWYVSQAFEWRCNAATEVHLKQTNKQKATQHAHKSFVI